MFVYFIKAFGEQDLLRIKIGSSHDPKARLRALQVGSPVKLRLMGTIKCKSDSHAKSVEKFAHNVFSKQRRKGEWFHLSVKHLKQMENLIQKCAASVGGAENA